MDAYHDGAGRRTSLLETDNPSLPYSFNYQADGSMTGVNFNGNSFQYTYGTDGLLTQRTSPWRTQSITMRDACGRIGAENTQVAGGTTVLSETSSWRGDSRMASFSMNGTVVAGGTGTDTRTYGYDPRGRVTTEPFFMVNSPNTSVLADGPQTSLYQFDNNIETGLGVRTLQYVNGYTGDVVGSQDGYQRATQDASYVPSSGGIIGSPWMLGYDAAGNVTSRDIIVSGTTYAAQTLTWDGFGRLVKVSQRDTGANDFDSTTVYDGFGRRVQSTWQPMNSGTDSGPSSYLQYYYDPNVEFLELGWNNNGADRQWKVYGPDTDGIYGGEQGCGGLEAEIDEAAGWAYIPVDDEFGDAQGVLYISSVVGSYSGALYNYNLALGGYGPEPGSGMDGIGFPTWRGHYQDYTGFVWMGARYYEPLSGKFLSPDPLGTGASMSLYDYCNGDPVNGLDPDGRCIEEGANVAYNGFGVGQDLKAASNALDSVANDAVGNNTPLAYTAAATSSILGSVSSLVTPKTYVDAGSQFVGNVGTVYNDSRATGDSVFGSSLLATGYGLTSWNIGAIYQGVNNVNVLTGQPLGGWVEQTESVISGIGGTAGLAAGGLSLYTGITASGATTAADSGLAVPAGYQGGPGAMWSGENIGTSDTYEILDGVRRAKAADMLGQDSITAKMLVNGQVQTVDVPISNQLSPKTSINVSNAIDAQRFSTTLEQTRLAPVGPDNAIWIQPGTNGTPIPGVTFSYGR